MEHFTKFWRRACFLAERCYDCIEPETLPVKLSEVFPHKGIPFLPRSTPVACSKHPFLQRRPRVDDITIIDIARFAGVSVSTVSRVLNNHPDVSRATRDAVMAVIDQHAYIPNNSARSLKRESVRAVGLVVKGLSNPFFTPMVAVVQNELDENRYQALLYQCDPNEDEVDAAISMVKEKKPRGLIFLGGNFQHSRGKLAMLGVPYVMATITMHKDVDRESFSSVTIDDYAEGYGVARHVSASGHTRVAAIGFAEEDKSISSLRIGGFMQALRDMGLPAEKNRVAFAGESSLRAGYEAAKHLLGQTDFTCLFCVSDVIALGALRALHDTGKAVPGDVSLVGFDGIEAGRYAIPSLATVKQPGREMAHESVQVLLNCLRRKGAVHSHHVFPAVWQEGESFKAR